MFIVIPPTSTLFTEENETNNKNNSENRGKKKIEEQVVYLPKECITNFYWNTYNFEKILVSSKYHIKIGN